MNANLILLGVLFGSVGFGFFIYGKKQKRPVPLICGIGLMVVPYLVDSTAWLMAAGTALSIIPFIVRL